MVWHKRVAWLWIVALMSAPLGTGAVADEPPVKGSADEKKREKPPESKREDTVDKMHGTDVPDPYRWLEKGDEQAVKDWVIAQNEYVRHVLNAPALRTRLGEELRKYNDITSSTSPSIHGDRYFFSRREGLKNHSIVYVREGRFDAPPRMLIDPNTFSDKGTVALDWMFPSADGSVVAYGKSASGSEKSTLYLKDVKSGKDLPETIPNTRFCNVAWEKDGKGFYYTRYPAPGSVPTGDENYFERAFYHKLGTQWEGDPCVSDKSRPKEETTGVHASQDHRFLFMTRSLVWTKNDVFMKDMRAGTPFKPVCEGLDALTDADGWGDTLYLRTSYNAPRFRIVRTAAASPSHENWKEVVPQKKGVIHGFDLIDGKLVVTVLENAYSRIMIYSADGQQLDEIKLPTLGSAAGVNGKYDDSNVFFQFESFAFPPTVFRYDMKDKKLNILDKMNLDKDVSAFETKQETYTSKDGTKVPIFVVHKKGLKLDGSNPTLLYGYGGFNISMTPSFRAGRYVWLDRGGVFAIACLRGGGEFGQEWHHAGRLGKKQNVFDDCIAAAEWLISSKYTDRDHLAVMGGSNGGLLTGAMIVQRPDLFRAVICAVPLLDMIRYPNYQIARLWMQEYGDPGKPEEFTWLIKYSPYHNVKKGAKYPAIMFETADSDGRVDPMHARKMTALLQASNGGDRPIMLRTDFDAGHGAGKPLAKVIEQQADEWVFLMTQTGMKTGT